MQHAGLDISDDAIHCIEYVRTPHGTHISKFASMDMPPDLVVGGDVKDEKALVSLLSKFDRDHDLSYVKVSIPEEKAYLFQTDVPSLDMKAVTQNIEFKLEENVPLAAADAVFYFDILPVAGSGGSLRASVSVVPKSHIENLIKLLGSSGIIPVAFEIAPKSVARAIIPADDASTVMIVHIMNRKTGIYVVTAGVVSFASTIPWGCCSAVDKKNDDVAMLAREVSRVYSYWMSHNQATSALCCLLLVGHDAVAYEVPLRSALGDLQISVLVADVWRTTLSLDAYIPPITRNNSFEYAVAAGLAINA